MKKTTYIIIGAIALCWLACLIFPPIYIKKTFIPTVNLSEDFKEGDGTMVRDTLPEFQSFTIDREYLPLYYKDGDGHLHSATVNIKIEEDTSLKVPIMESAAIWKKNIRYELDDDGELTATIDFSNYKKNSSDNGRIDMQLITETPFLYAATIRVPAGILTHISNKGYSRLGITLQGLHSDSITCEGDPKAIQFEDCSFKSLRWE